MRAEGRAAGAAFRTGPHFSSWGGAETSSTWAQTLPAQWPQKSIQTSIWLRSESWTWAWLHPLALT